MLTQKLFANGDWSSAEKELFFMLFWSGMLRLCHDSERRQVHERELERRRKRDAIVLEKARRARERKEAEQRKRKQQPDAGHQQEQDVERERVRQERALEEEQRAREEEKLEQRKDAKRQETEQRRQDKALEEEARQARQQRELGQQELKRQEEIRQQQENPFELRHWGSAAALVASFPEPNRRLAWHNLKLSIRVGDFELSTLTQRLIDPQHLANRVNLNDLDATVLQWHQVRDKVRQLLVATHDSTLRYWSIVYFTPDLATHMIHNSHDLSRAIAWDLRHYGPSASEGILRLYAETNIAGESRSRDVQMSL